MVDAEEGGDEDEERSCTILAGVMVVLLGMEEIALLKGMLAIIGELAHSIIMNDYHSSFRVIRGT